MEETSSFRNLIWIIAICVVVCVGAYSYTVGRKKKLVTELSLKRDCPATDTLPSAVSGTQLVRPCPSGYVGNQVIKCQDGRYENPDQSACQKVSNSSCSGTAIFGPAINGAVVTAQCPNGLLGVQTSKCIDGQYTPSDRSQCHLPKCAAQSGFPEASVGPVSAECSSGSGYQHAICGLDGLLREVDTAGCLSGCKEDEGFPAIKAGRTAYSPCPSGSHFRSRLCRADGQWDEVDSVFCFDKSKRSLLTLWDHIPRHCWRSESCGFLDRPE